MILLFDAGNTRLKWGLAGEGGWLAQGVCEYTQLDQWPLQWPADAHPTHALGVNVAGAERGGEIEACLARRGIETRFIQSAAAQCGVTNLYRNPAQLGSDRFAALIGARAHHAGPALVVCAGTATTLDYLDAQGRFQGGMILPGFDLMRASLARGTAGLPMAHSEVVALPRSTDEAIIAGCMAAQVGAVLHMWQHLPESPDRLCILSGGAAPRLLPHLSIPWRVVPNLVLEGVLKLARCGL